MGDHRRAADLFRSIVTSLDDDLSRQLLGHSGYPSVLARARLALALAELGEFEEGIAWGEDGIRLAEALDHPMSLAYACTRLGQLHAVKGDFERAAHLLERGLGLTRDWQITFTAALVTGDLGHVYTRLQRTAEGLTLLREAIDAYESRKVEAVKARLLVHLGEAYLLADRFEDARACAGRSLAHTRVRGERAAEAYALRLLADIATHRHRPDLEAAEGAYHESMVVAGKLGMRPLVAHCQRGLGTLYRRVGRVHAAREHLGAAAATFRQMAMKPWLEEAEAELRRLAAITVWLTAHLLDVVPGLPL
jgi:tetratricopeptide (TPR) repeat protein